MAWPATPPGADGYDELRLGLGLGLLEANLAYRLVVEKKIAESVDVAIDPGHLASLVLLPAADVGSAVEQFLADAPHVTIVVTPDPSAPRAGALR